MGLAGALAEALISETGGLEEGGENPIIGKLRRIAKIGRVGKISGQTISPRMAERVLKVHDELSEKGRSIWFGKSETLKRMLDVVDEIRTPYVSRES